MGVPREVDGHGRCVRGRENWSGGVGHSPVVGVRCRVMQAADVGPFGVEGRGAGDVYDCGFLARGRGDGRTIYSKNRR